MPAFNAISADQLSRLVGTPRAPRVIDVRTDEDFALDPRLIPAALRRPHADVLRWAADPAVRDASDIVVACRKGLKLAQGVAAWLRQLGLPARTLEGGTLAWADVGLPLVPTARLPRRDAAGRTVWVTRWRPKVDRIACAWLIRRFVDPDAAFLFIAPSEVPDVAVRFDATPFDIEGDGVAWTHRGDLCTFDVMVEELGLAAEPALVRLATIVRGADTARPDLAPQAAGLLAVSLGLSRVHADDLRQLDAGMIVYDALYRWCRDAADETHDWVSHAPKTGRQP